MSWKLFLKQIIYETVSVELNLSEDLIVSVLHRGVKLGLEQVTSSCL